MVRGMEKLNTQKYASSEIDHRNSLDICSQLSNDNNLNISQLKNLNARNLSGI